MRRMAIGVGAILMLAMAISAGVLWHRWNAQASVAWAEVVEESAELDAAIQSKQLALVDGRETPMHAALKRLRRAPWVALFDARRLRRSLEELSSAASETHAAADAEDQEHAERAWARAKSALIRARDLMPERLRSAAVAEKPVRYTCPMHPEVASDKPGRCPRCGMPLEPQNRSTGPYVSASVSPDAPLRVGQPAQRTLVLSAPDGAPITLGQLMEVHTKKIHLLIVDESLTDYHHEHPVPSGKDGEYSFSFVPSRPGRYHVWADVMPERTQVQEFAPFIIEGEGMGLPLPSADVQLVDTEGPLRFELSYDGALARGATTSLHLVITRGGAVFSGLEPIMGTYAHLVAFSRDFGDIAHIHPLGAAPTSDEDRGRGELEFAFRPKVSGTLVMFAQVQVGGESRFARFMLQVADPSLANSNARDAGGR